MVTTQVHTQRLPPLDDPWRRIAWLLPAAIITWMVLLLVFARLLEQSAPPPPELKPIEARIVEIPPPAPVGGLQSGGGSPAHVAKPQPKPIAKPAPRPHPAAPRVAPAPPSANGTLRKKKNEPPPAAAGDKNSKAPPAGEESEPSGESETSGEGGGGGIGGGTDSSGARAIYSPAPVIPDDLREDAIQTEAVASFKVAADGTVEVSLSTPTANPRLNQVLLDALRQWKFFPATRNGVAIDAAFEVRIPITVQ